ncbi:hypothetical protein G9A89_011236 [Geosiphon pyriformis]|nr:hypothetical protein G9A89_011236 [Geosiphon pyriformis]
MAQNEGLAFQVGEKILCYHGPMIYEAKILKAEVFTEKHPESSETGPHYLIHYKGWKNTWDEWVVESRVLKFNESNLAKQKALKSTFAQSKNKSTSTAASTSSTTMSSTPIKKLTQESGVSSEKTKKRKRDSIFDKNELIKRQKLALFDVPEPLRALLVHDWENINKYHLVVPLPRKPSVQNIIEDYKRHLQEKSGEIGEEAEEVLKGVKLYFNKSLSGRLLYRDERKQYNDLKSKFDPPEYDNIYGAEHLLRLFVTFPDILTQSLLGDDIVGTLKEHIVDFLNFINENRKTFFIEHYEKIKFEL